MKKLSSNEMSVLSMEISKKVNEIKYEKIKGKLEKDVDAEQVKTWTRKLISPKSENLFSEDFYMYFPPNTVNNAAILTAFKAAVTDQTANSKSDCKEAIEAYYPKNMRSQFIDTGRNKIILDAYNANPSSMEGALDTFASIEAENKMFKDSLLVNMYSLNPEKPTVYYTMVGADEHLLMETKIKAFTKPFYIKNSVKIQVHSNNKIENYLLFII
jgi:UDP-N-acetylmuramyl pentapeptide synthase